MQRPVNPALPFLRKLIREDNMINDNASGWVQRIDRTLDGMGAKLQKRQWNIPTDLLGGILFLLFGLAMLFIIPDQIEIKKKEIVNGRAFPNLLMYIMIACSVVLIVTQIVKIVRKQPVKTTAINLLVEVKALLLFLFMLVYYFVCQRTNFAVGSCVFVVLMLLFFRCKKPLYYAVTLSAAVLIWAAFRFGLGVLF